MGLLGLQLSTSDDLGFVDLRTSDTMTGVTDAKNPQETLTGMNLPLILCSGRLEEPRKRTRPW